MMKQFADTFYFLALLNPKDRAHATAMALSHGPASIVTTEWILTDLADAMAWHTKRQGFMDLYRLLRSNPAVHVVPATTELFARGMTLFIARDDKDWSLTDCISFVVMQEHGLTDALTGDHHFEQAGFRVLMQG